MQFELSGKDCPLSSGLVAYDEFSSGWTKKGQKDLSLQTIYNFRDVSGCMRIMESIKTQLLFLVM